MRFTHLAVRTEFSIIDCIIRIKQLVKTAKKDGQTSLGIADMSNMFAIVKFYKACLDEKIKPIIGTEMTIKSEQATLSEPTSVIFYAMNNDGYHNLLQLVSKGYTDGLNLGVPVVDFHDVKEYSKGVIAILTERSEIGTPLKSGRQEQAGQILQNWQSVFADRLYIGIKRTNRPFESEFIHHAILTANPLNIPLVAYNDVRFLTQDDFDAHEARVCIAQGYTLGDSSRPRIYSESQYFKSQDEMATLFADLPQVLTNTNDLASRCNVNLTLGINVLPDFPIPKGETMETYFKKVSFEGLYARLAILYPKDKRDDSWQVTQKTYEDRLDYELGIINNMGFAGYFLIVMDFIRWAKENGVPVGPGRGSGAGSLVAYSLNITDLDPLAYDLLFERFLNPERVSMPDFDIDFCIEGRDRVIDYVARTYGRDAVSQIITFGTMAAKAVVRDVARVQGKPYMLGDKISKLIPKTPGISLDEAVEKESQLKELLTNPEAFDHDDALEIWETAKKLEGITRNVGKHAGGVLIAPNRISDFSAVYCDDEGHRVSQYDKDDVEAVGLVKFDFLGLRNLTVIQSALDNINYRLVKDGKEPIALEDIALDDENVYKGILQTGKTSAVFQLESLGMKKYLKQLKPTNIEDVIAMCALYRPGPLEANMVQTFIDRKNGIEDICYPHPQYQHEWLIPALSPTYGTIVYQEQVMQIAQVLSGYTLGGADMLRRAMGKKKPEEMAKQRAIFVDGAIGKGVDGELAGKIFDLVEFFAGYGFNKSHSAAYGVLAYQTAYLKHYYTADFMAAVLTSEMNNTDAVVFLIDDCKENFGLTVLPPSVNDSQWQFIAIDDKTIVYGLGAIKGVGVDAVDSIVKARNDGEFLDLFDFCNRVDIKKVGKRTLEALVMAGCFDVLAKKIKPDLTNDKAYQIRGALWEQLPLAMRAGEQNRSNNLSGTIDLFAQIDTGLAKAPPLSDIIWSNKKRLENENNTLGLYLTGHPIDDYRLELGHYVHFKKLTDLSETGFTGGKNLAGLIVDVANFGNRVVITLDDSTARIDISCYSDKFGQFKDILKIGEIVIIKVSVKEHEGRLFARLLNAYTLYNARLKHLQKINLKLKDNDLHTLSVIVGLLKENTANIKPITKEYDENGNVLSLPNEDGCLAVNLFIYNELGIGRVLTNERFRIPPTDDALSVLYSHLPKESVKIV